MGSIIPRKRKDGSTVYGAQIVVYRDGKIAHRESKTFDRRQAAKIWIDKREAALAEPGGVDAAKLGIATNITLSEAIDKYLAESRKSMGRTKTQVLKALKEFPIASSKCADIKSHHLVDLAKQLMEARSPQTVENYMSHLRAVFAVAKPAWNVELDREAIADARIVTKRMGYTSKSRDRSRRPTCDEIQKIMERFRLKRWVHKTTPPMHMIVPFALFSTRRQEEICRITWADFDKEGGRVLVRDIKNPGEKIGNDVWVSLPPEASEIVSMMPKTDDRIFPCNHRTVSASFTRACKILGIEDLHFHDLRHEGVSRLFEMGWNIPQVAAVSGHKSWISLRRYTHIRQTGDKWAGDWWR
ncbi:MAG: tyrosine-type recombinase/integrase [Methylocystis sp.]|uniref:tyrosine-type recombinase/integrase n=1 Tax=Methylocystis sp. TaxID=1911079 RepID=UPI003DA21C29